MFKQGLIYENTSGRVQSVYYRYYYGANDYSWSMLADYFTRNTHGEQLKVCFEWMADNCSRVKDYNLIFMVPSNLSKFKFAPTQDPMDWEENITLKKFFKDNFGIKVEVYTNMNDHKTAVIIRSKDHVKVKAVYCKYNEYLPWLHIELTDDDLRLLECFMRPDGYEYVKSVADELQRTNGQDALDRFYENLKQTQVESLTQALEYVERRINSKSIEIGELIQERNTTIEKINAVNSRETESLTEIFKEYKSINVDNVAGPRICISVTTTWNNWDEDEAVRVNDTMLYNYCNRGSKMQRLMKEIVDRKYKLRVIAKYSINLEAMRVEAIPGRFNKSGYMDNPHISRFACLGQYAGMMCNALEQGTIRNVLDICCASAASINIMESPSMRWMIEQMDSYSDHYGACLIDTETGELRTIDEVLNEYDQVQSASVD